MPDANFTEKHLKASFERGLDGDKTAYNEFLVKMGELLRAYVRRQLRHIKRSDYDAEDIVQEVLLAIHTKRYVYDPDVPITAWAHVIARYRLIDYLRTTGRLYSNVSLEEIDDLADVASAPLDVVLSLKALIANLPERFRRPIELMKLRGLSAREAATISNTSESSIKVNVHRGIRALARGWKGR